MTSDLTPYQRGNRDGLLNAAAQLDAHAALYTAAAEKIRTGRGFRYGHVPHENLWRLNLEKAHVLYEASVTLRRLSEALPDDPEAPTPDRSCT